MFTNASVTTRHLFHISQAFHTRDYPLFGHTILCSPAANTTKNNHNLLIIHSPPLPTKTILHHKVLKATTGNDDAVASTNDDEDGVTLGTMKLPLDTDLARFETLLFQWGNSLSQGANLPLPAPLKVDKIPGGARLGFIIIGDGKTEVLVYIDCLVFPATDSSGPIFRAIRNGPLKTQPPPGEPRIMRSLLAALQKSVEIARI
ncbi:hypothetical protein ACH5RR_004544 [Cinchona calisaya]|uniref:DUF7148 domain-containing protein n=1 Tax=Cinchona calisaya TaxID=153742 RepID=A0ABD3AY88_9GENT